MDPEYTAPVGDSGSGNGVDAGSPPSTEQPKQGTQPQPGASTGSAPSAAQPPVKVPDGYIPRERLNEVTSRARHEIAQLQARVREFEALAGRRPAPPPNPEADAIRNQLFELVPGLKELAALPADKIQRLLEMSPQIEAHTQQYWTNVGGLTLRQLHDAMEKVYGGKVDPQARAMVQAAFTHYLENDQEAYARYVNQDPTLAQEFFANYQKLMLDPFSRAALAREQARAERRNALPTPGPRTGVTANGNPPPKPKDDEERGSMAWAAFNAQR